ncbi:MAG TPA: D-alanyl-D-alanine carboxypeptidase [Candidatus Dormibacteraeota bacterium]
MGIAIFGLMGLHALTTPPHRSMRAVAATTGTHAAVVRTAVPSHAGSAAPQPSLSPSHSPVPTALPVVKVPILSRSWLRAHPVADPPHITGRAAIVVDLASGQVLYEQAATARYADASLTKMMTAMVATDLASMDTVITVSPQATLVEPNHMGLSPGEQLTLRELLDGLLLNSGNDAAEAIAGGIVDRDKFIDFMNQKAAALHLRATHFTNPSGFDDPNHYSSASDLAVVASTLLDDYPDLRAIVGAKLVTIPPTAQHKAFNPSNIDRLLWTYPGAIGLKPGYTDAAGYCLAAAATRGGRTIVAIVLGSTQHFTDAATLLDFGFHQPVTR